MTNRICLPFQVFRNLRDCCLADSHSPPLPLKKALRPLLTLAMLGLFCPQLVSTASAQSNPLGDLFKRLDRNVRGWGEETNRSKYARDPLDFRPVQRPEETRRLDQVDQMVKQNRWHDAIEILQHLSEIDEDAFISTPKDGFLSLQAQREATLNNLPAEGKRSYENRFGPQAAALLKQARDQQSEELLQEISNRYLWTPSGAEATKILANLWADRGDFALAARTWLRYAQTQPEGPAREATLQAARLMAESGNHEQSQKILDAVLTPDEADALLKGIQKQFSDSGSVPEELPDILTNPSAVDTNAESLLLMTRWTNSLVDRYRIKNHLRDLNRELRSRKRALIPAVQPLVINDVIAYRTLQGIELRNIESGQLIWENRSAESLENILAPGNQNSASQHVLYDIPQGESFHENQSMMTLFYRNDAFSKLSTDGRSLFYVQTLNDMLLSDEDDVWNRMELPVSEKQKWQSNELISYDLTTGRQRWVIGGHSIEDAFTRPLSGTFFFGPPTARGRELYVIGEHQAEISLFCLSSESGELIWSQPLSTPGRPVNEDPVRTHWACSPIIVDGMILCPTSTGWLVAVDQATRRLLWTARYAPYSVQQNSYRNEYASQSVQELNRRWHGQPIWIDGDRIVVASPELPDEYSLTQPLLCCFHLQTGERLWDQFKTNGLYVAGIWNHLAIVVNEGGIVARDLSKKGEEVWKVPFQGSPSGIGTIVGNHLLLPLNGSELICIDLADEKIVSRVTVSEQDAVLGNLLLTGKHLIAFSSDQAGVFPLTEPAQESIDLSPELVVRALLRRAEVLSSNQQTDQVLELLSDPVFTEDETYQFEAQTLKRKALIQKIQSDLTAAEEALTHLQELSQTDAQRREHRRLQANFRQAIGDWPAALEDYLHLLADSPLQESVIHNERTLHPDIWTGSQLRSLYRSLNSHNQDRMIELAQQHLQSLSDQEPFKKQLARAFQFHRWGQQLELELAQQAFQNENIAEGIVRCQRAAESSDQQIQVAAIEAMMHRFHQLEWFNDAELSAKRLLNFPPQPLPSGKDSHQEAQRLLTLMHQQKSETPEEAPYWGTKWKTERLGSGTYRPQFHSITASGNGIQQFEQFRFVNLDTERLLRIESVENGKFQGSFKVGGNPSLVHSQNMGIRTSGPYAYVVNQGVVHAIAWPDAIRKWSWHPGASLNVQSQASVVSESNHFGFVGLNIYAATHKARFASRNRTGYLLEATPQRLLLWCGEWIALDPITGEELWKFHEEGEWHQAFSAGPDRLLMSNDDRKSLHDAYDGSLLPDQNGVQKYDDALLIEDQERVLLTRQSSSPSSASREWTLQRLNAQDRLLWSVPLSANSLIRQPDSRTFIWYHPEKGLGQVDLQTGKQTQFDPLPEGVSVKGQDQLSMISDQDQHYLVAGQGVSHGSYIGLPSVQISGTLIAYGKDGKLRWSRTINGSDYLQGADESGRRRPWALNLLTDELNVSPLLFCIGDRPDRRGELHFRRLAIVGIDKKTGEVAIEWNQPTESGGLMALLVNVHDRRIELRTYAERIILSTKQPAVSQKDETP